MPSTFGGRTAAALLGPPSGEEADLEQFLEPHPMTIEPGTALDGRFVLLRLLGKGGFGSAWLAEDLSGHRNVVVKLSHSSLRDDVFQSYQEHIDRLRKAIPRSTTGIALPIASGEAGDHYYEVHEYDEHRESLEGLLRKSGALPPRAALHFVSLIADIVAQLHEQGVIHADLKPANILVGRDGGDSVKLIDFGMVAAIGESNSLFVLGTYAYLHPELTSGTAAALASSAARLRVRTDATTIGPYIDIYSLGVIALQLLTIDARVPRPLTQQAIARQLSDGNAWLLAAEAGKVEAVAQFIFQMLSVSSRREAISARTAASISQSLALLFPEKETDPPAQMPQIVDAAELASYVSKLEHVASELLEASRAYVVREGKFEILPAPIEDERVLREVGAIFSNALQQARITWKFGVATTLASFGFIVSMALAALILTVVTGESQWALIFGGTSIVTIIGTLIWRPFDRLYRATVRTQQIEMIHIQTVAGFRGTTDMERRLTICREAVAALDQVLHGRVSSDVEKSDK